MLSLLTRDGGVGGTERFGPHTPHTAHLITRIQTSSSDERETERCKESGFRAPPLAKIISLLPGCGYQLVCPIFEGAIVRPVSSVACIEGLRGDLAERYGVSIRSRDVSPQPADCDRPHINVGPAIERFPCVSNVNPAAPLSSQDAIDGRGNICGSASDRYDLPGDGESLCGSDEADASASSTTREEPPGLSGSPSRTWRPSPYGAMRGSDVDPASNNKLNPAPNTPQPNVPPHKHPLPSPSPPETSLSRQTQLTRLYLTPPNRHPSLLR